MTTAYSPEQQRIASELSAQFGFPPDMVHFLNKKKPTYPWLSADALLAIARATPTVKSIAEQFQDYIGELSQVLHIATVILDDGRSFSRTGVARIGEKLPDGSDDWDEHYLAASRALRSTLDAAGIDPTKRPDAMRPVAQFAAEKTASTDAGLAAAEMKRDLARIHILAVEAGLIVRGQNAGDSAYRQFLRDRFRVDSALNLDPAGRQSLINALEQKWQEANL